MLPMKEAHRVSLKDSQGGNASENLLCYVQWFMQLMPSSDEFSYSEKKNGSPK